MFAQSVRQQLFVTGISVLFIAIPLLANEPAKNVRSTLATRIPEVAFEEQPLERVLDWLRDVSNSNIVVRWQTLEDHGIDREKPISLRVRDLRLDQVLALILEQAAGSDVRLGYLAGSQLITIGTTEELDRQKITKVYDVSDLLVRTPRFRNAQTIDPAQSLQGLSSGGAGLGGGGGSGTPLIQPGATREDDDVEGGSAEDIAGLIRDTIAPDSWRENGAGEGSIRVWRNLLIVHASLRVHQMIGGPVQE